MDSSNQANVPVSIICENIPTIFCPLKNSHETSLSCYADGSAFDHVMVKAIVPEPV
jgi:hypothetical protein